MDVASKSAIHDKLEELTDKGDSMIVASSDLDELMRISDRILVLSKKRLVSVLSPDRWSKHKILEATFNLKYLREDRPMEVKNNG